MFQLFKDTIGEWRFRLVAENGEIVASSEGYKHKSDARHGIAIVKSASKADVEELDETPADFSLLIKAPIKDEFEGGRIVLPMQDELARRRDG